LNWDDEVVVPGKWYDKKLFNIGDFEVSAFMAAVGTGGLIAIIIVSILICCACSYWKRKEIAEGGRRLSGSMRSAGNSLRNSMRKGSSD
jgi:hypothetical protein